MSDKNQHGQHGDKSQQGGQHESQHGTQQPHQQGYQSSSNVPPHQQGMTGQQPREPGEGAHAGDRLPNPAQPYAETVVPERPDASSFMRPGVGELHPSGYPKLKYHPVHGGITVKDPGEESNLYPPTDWFDSAELADMARTHTEAEAVRFNNQIAKLKEMEEKGHPVVRNSVQADEAIRLAQPEPL